MNFADWEHEVSAALSDRGKEYTAELQHLMRSAPDPATKDIVKPRALEITEAMEWRFWMKAMAGQTFGPDQRIRQKFGKSLEENYDVSSGPFLNVARAYWTYKIEVDDLFPVHSHKWLSHALLAVEINLRVLFFPTPGPVSIPVQRRRVAQRQALEHFAPKMDIDRFLKENPLLKGKQSTGCLGAVVVLSTVLLGLALYGGYIVSA